MPRKPQRQNFYTLPANLNQIAVRQGEVPAADFTNGVNRGGGNNVGMGICTGIVNPKPSDWAFDEQPLVTQRTATIGAGTPDSFWPATAVFMVFPNDNPLNVRQGAFVEAAGAVAPQELVATVEGFELENQSLDTLQAGDKIWAAGFLL